MFSSESIELKQQILDKLNKLLSRQEYYEFQERVYRTSKALNSIARSSDITVSNFMDIDDIPKEKKDFTLESLKEITEALDGLLMEKKDKNSIMYLLASSSSDEEVDELPEERSKKCLMRNLWNLELTLRAQLLEKSLEKAEHRNSSTLSTSVQNSSISKCRGSFKSATPMTKNFFEDDETIGFRRHSMGEMYVIALETSLMANRRRSHDIDLVSGIKKLFTIEEECVSNFTFGLPGINEEDCRSEHSDC
jgi:hypothetical protein